ncbi:MAG TPA: TonB-dependent receptor [Pseudomonadaceae bacterium]|nr:TonB-dependent receptor [Pseudomonadaceae bacterium]
MYSLPHKNLLSNAFFLGSVASAPIAKLPPLSKPPREPHMKYSYPQLGLLALSAGFSLNAFAQAGTPDLPPPTAASRLLVGASAVAIEEIYVTSRRRQELAQDIPIPVTVVSGKLVADTGGFNVNRIKELIPSVQLYSSNPRNTAISIRGQGTTFGLTNDGIDPGVGYYIDGVFFARPAITTLDFLDVERIEVLRGPQGTLYGKNSTAGAFNVTTQKPQYEPEARVELSTGNYNYAQLKGTVAGGLSDTVAGRLSFTSTERDGLLTNAASGKKVNDIENWSLRGQLLWEAGASTDIRLIAELSRQDPTGSAQVFAGSVTTNRSAYRQFEAIIADLDYAPPSRDPFDRLIDHNTTWRSGNDIGGLSLNIDHEIFGGTLTSTSAWYFWDWRPSNDRDFLGLDSLAKSEAPSDHEQWTQEFRWTGDLSDKVSGVFGLFAIQQELESDPVHREEMGSDQWRFLAPNPASAAQYSTPGLFDGFGINSSPGLETFSAALFGQLDWRLSDRLNLLTGLRFNYDEKEVNFIRTTSGGAPLDDPALEAIRNSAYAAQSFQAEIDDDNVTGTLTLNYALNDAVNVYGTYSTGFKPIGLNLGGLPRDAGRVMTELSVIKPEYVQHYELGVKTSPLPNAWVNFVAYQTDIEDYQAQVQTADISVNRGYLANAEQVRVRGFEIDGRIVLGNFSLQGAYAWTDGEYVSFHNAPLPLEEAGGAVAFKDVSGGRLPGISRNAVSLSGEYSRLLSVLGNNGEFFIGLDGYYRSEFSSSPSPSQILNVPGYTLLNARVGFRSDDSWSVFLWSRNLTDKDYFEQLLPGAGSYGHYAAVLGDQRTWGATLRYAY